MADRLADDTPPEIEQQQIERWRSMSTAEKGHLISALTQAAFELALAGIRDRYPNATKAEQRLRLAMLTLGPELAARVDPECAALSRADAGRSA